MFDSNDEIEAYRRGMGLPPLLGMSNVIIFRWSRAERPVEGSHQELLQVRTALVRKILQQQFGTGMYFYDIDFDRIASIVTFTPESWSESEFREKVGEGVRLIRRAVSVGTGEERLIVGVGTLTSNNTGISGSAERALAAADYMPLTETQPIVWYSEMPTEGSAYYPLELATELINSVRSGDSPDIARLVDLVFQKNFVGSRLPLREQQQLKFDLRDTVQKLAEQFPAGDDEMTGRLHHGMSRFDESATVEDMFRDLRSVLALIAESADLRKKSHNVKLRDAVVRHVHTNFTDADLYLATVAAEFGITKEYLSQFFKEQTGVKFSTYIERLRIGKASELMGNNALTVSQVAIACGYRSPQVFRRAFKRITGATPKELRLTG